MNNVHSNKAEISIVIPVYGCDESIIEIYERLVNVLSGIAEKYEIIFIDDCGPGDSWRLIKEISEKDDSVYGIRLSRNFGQHVAITAGLVESTGNWIVVMDCDLQDKPEEIIKLYDAAQSGVDIVYAQRANRQDSFLKKLSSSAFYSVLGYLTDTKLDSSVANYGIYSRQVIDAVLSMNEDHKYFPVMVRWVGFSSISIPVAHDKRVHGETSYTFRKLIALSIGIILSFSDKPLRLIIKSGFVMSFLSACYAVLLVYWAYTNNNNVPGWSSVMVSMWFIGGVLMSIIGVVGAYVGKTFDESKSRPLYIIRSRV
jgi:polyisoprenyl-phosphate glycosyltransferase